MEEVSPSRHLISECKIQCWYDKERKDRDLEFLSRYLWCPLPGRASSYSVYRACFSSENRHGMETR